jgi:hypothetical protein
LVVGDYEPIDENSSALAGSRHHSNQIFFAAFRFFLDEGKSQIKAYVLSILIIELFHLRGNDEEDIGDVRIGGVYLMDILLRLGIIVANASKILVDFLVSNILLIDIQEIFR